MKIVGNIMLVSYFSMSRDVIGCFTIVSTLGQPLPYCFAICRGMVFTSATKAVRKQNEKSRCLRKSFRKELPESCFARMANYPFSFVFLSSYDHITIRAWAKPQFGMGPDVIRKCMANVSFLQLRRS